MRRPERPQPLKIRTIAVAISGRESPPTRIPQPAKASKYETFEEALTYLSEGSITDRSLKRTDFRRTIRLIRRFGTT
jgi:hypothetical protein